MSSDDGSPDAEPFNDALGRVAEELWRIAEDVHAHEGWWAADAGVDAVHSIVDSAAHALRAIAGWYDRSSDHVFDDRLGAEQDAFDVVAHAERALRTFAADVQAVAERHAGLVTEVDHLEHRDLYALSQDELGEHAEYFAVLEVSTNPDGELVLGAYDREDVARHRGQASARAGHADSLYRVVEVRDGARRRTLVQWHGEGDPQA